MKIVYSKGFARMFNALPISVQGKAKEKKSLFKDNPFSKSLKTHKLKGKFKACYSFSVDYDYRIVFKFTGKDTAVFMLIGDHSIYQ